MRDGYSARIGHLRKTVAGFQEVVGTFVADNSAWPCAAMQLAEAAAPAAYKAFAKATVRVQQALPGQVVTARGAPCSANKIRQTIGQAIVRQATGAPCETRAIHVAIHAAKDNVGTATRSLQNVSERALAGCYRNCSSQSCGQLFMKAGKMRRSSHISSGHGDLTHLTKAVAQLTTKAGSKGCGHVEGGLKLGAFRDTARGRSSIAADTSGVASSSGNSSARSVIMRRIAPVVMATGAAFSSNPARAAPAPDSTSTDTTTSDQTQVPLRTEDTQPIDHSAIDGSSGLSLSSQAVGDGGAGVGSASSGGAGVAGAPWYGVGGNFPDEHQPSFARQAQQVGLTQADLNSLQMEAASSSAMLNYWSNPTKFSGFNPEPEATPLDNVQQKRAKRQRSDTGVCGIKRASGNRKRRAAWSPEEDARLRRAVLQYDANRWTLIAAEVNEGRTAAEDGGESDSDGEGGMIRTAEQCRHRWNRTLRHQQQCETGEWRSGPWTEEDDALLMELVRQQLQKRKTDKEKGELEASSSAAADGSGGGATGDPSGAKDEDRAGAGTRAEQASTVSTRPTTRRTRASTLHPDSDATSTTAPSHSDTNKPAQSGSSYFSSNHCISWACMEKQMKRTAKACRERWVDRLSPLINKSAVTEAEDQLILILHKQLGNRWAAIAHRLPDQRANRTWWFESINSSAQQELVSESATGGVKKEGSTSAKKAAARHATAAAAHSAGASTGAGGGGSEEEDTGAVRPSSLIATDPAACARRLIDVARLLADSQAEEHRQREKEAAISAGMDPNEAGKKKGDGEEFVYLYRTGDKIKSRYRTLARRARAREQRGMDSNAPAAICRGQSSLPPSVTAGGAVSERGGRGRSSKYANGESGSGSSGNRRRGRGQKKNSSNGSGDSAERSDSDYPGFSTSIAANYHRMMTGMGDGGNGGPANASCMEEASRLAGVAGMSSLPERMRKAMSTQPQYNGMPPGLAAGAGGSMTVPASMAMFMPAPFAQHLTAHMQGHAHGGQPGIATNTVPAAAAPGGTAVPASAGSQSGTGARGAKMPSNTPPFMPFTHHFGLQPKFPVAGVQFYNADGTPSATPVPASARGGAYSNRAGSFSSVGKTGNGSSVGSIGSVDSAGSMGSISGGSNQSSDSELQQGSGSGNGMATRSSRRGNKRGAFEAGPGRSADRSSKRGRGSGSSPTTNLLDMDLNSSLFEFGSPSGCGAGADGSGVAGGGAGGGAAMGIGMPGMMSGMMSGTMGGMMGGMGVPGIGNQHAALDLDALLDTLGLDAREEEALALQRSLKMYLR